ncbi:methyltransferase domain-containing protein [archaeon]|nr:MAG: methyltransferase domain-containing protein [archaeon]
MKDLGVVDGKGCVGGIQQLIQCDVATLPSANPPNPNSPSSDSPIENYALQVDEEFLPFKEDSFDLVLSSLNMHWVNDLPSSLQQVSRIDHMHHDSLLISEVTEH